MLNSQHGRYQAYLHKRDWQDTLNLTVEGRTKLERMLNAHINLGGRLRGYGSTTNWSV